MCRHLAYVGPPVRLAALLSEPSHALAHQARRPCHQISGDTNPHGWGVAWWSSESGAHQLPARYRTTLPIWDDHDFPAAEMSATGALGAARLASPGTSLDDRNNAPFVDGIQAFSLNGFAFAGGRSARLIAALSPKRAESLLGDSDAEVLFALYLDHLDAGAELGAALEAVIALVDPGDDARVNVLVTDGFHIAGTVWGNSLFVHRDGEAVLVASEPLDDDPGWSRIPDRSLVAAHPGSFQLQDL